MKIAFLHTSNSHIARFDAIVKKLNKSIEVAHYVNEDLLAIAQKTGKADRAAFDEQICQIQKNGNSLIVCTCSTYGELCDKRNHTYRIDEPIGRFIVSHYSNIGIAYTVSSTKKTSKALIERLAKEHKKSIQVVEIDCSICWHWFEKGNMERYEAEIANQIKLQTEGIEVVFLAQASMQGAKKYLVNEKYDVVSSPEFGVNKYLEQAGLI